MSEGMNKQSHRQGIMPNPRCTLAGTFLPHPPRNRLMTGAMPRPKVQQVTSVSSVPKILSCGPCTCHFSGHIPSLSLPLLAPAPLPSPFLEHSAHLYSTAFALAVPSLGTLFSSYIDALLQCYLPREASLVSFALSALSPHFSLSTSRQH